MSDPLNTIKCMKTGDGIRVSSIQEYDSNDNLRGLVIRLYNKENSSLPFLELNHEIGFYSFNYLRVNKKESCKIESKTNGTVIKSKVFCKNIKEYSVEYSPDNEQKYEIGPLSTKDIEISFSCNLSGLN